MFPGMELMGCQDLAVPAEVMQHVVKVESSFNPYAIGVVGGRLVRQPRNLPEALATARMLEQRGYNFSLGLAQVNRKNLEKYGLDSYEKAFQACPNLQAGSRILAECYSRSRGSWPKSFSCYYSGDFKTGFRHGYVQKIYASIRAASPASEGTSDVMQIVDPGESNAAASTASARAQPLDAKRIAATWPASIAPASPATGPAMTPARGQMPVRVSLAGKLEAEPMAHRQTDGTRASAPPTGATPTAFQHAQSHVDAAFVF